MSSGTQRANGLEVGTNQATFKSLQPARAIRAKSRSQDRFLTVVRQKSSDYVSSIVAGRRGIRGAFTAAVVDEIEKRLKRPARECFDLIAGTSTGAIVAAGIAKGESGAKIVQFYRTHVPRSLLVETHSFVSRMDMLHGA